jgi:hypothetical protein
MTSPADDLADVRFVLILLAIAVAVFMLAGCSTTQSEDAAITTARTDAANTFTGHQTEGVATVGATGTGNLVFATSPAITTAALTNPTVTNYVEGANSVSPSATSSTCTSFTISATTYTCTTAGAGTVAVGQVLSGTGITAGTAIIANIAGSGSGSTWTVNISQSASTGTATGAPGAYIDLTLGTWWKVTQASNTTITLPTYTANAGKSFTVTVCSSGAYTPTFDNFAGTAFAGWTNTNTAPTATATNGQCDNYVFGVLPGSTGIVGSDGGRHFTGS